MYCYYVAFDENFLELPGAWHPALISKVNDDTFHYYSDVWEDGTPFNTDQNWTDVTVENSLFDAYANIYVQGIRIHMDDDAR